MDIESMTVMQLRQELKKLGISTDGRKADLKERFANAIANMAHDVDDDDVIAADEPEARVKSTRSSTRRSVSRKSKGRASTSVAADDVTVEIAASDRPVTPKNTVPLDDAEIRQSSRRSRSHQNVININDESFLSDDSELQLLPVTPTSVRKSSGNKNTGGASGSRLNNPKSGRRTNTRMPPPSADFLSDDEPMDEDIVPEPLPVSNKETEKLMTPLIQRSRSRADSESSATDSKNRPAMAFALDTVSSIRKKKLVKSSSRPPLPTDSAKAHPNTPVVKKTAESDQSSKKILSGLTPNHRRVLAVTPARVVISPRAGNTSQKRAKTNLDKLSSESKSIGKHKNAPAGTFTSRFAAQHAKLAENAETLEEGRDRLIQRHQSLTKNVPDVVKRLATPKATQPRQSKLPGRALFGNPNVVPSNFNFGSKPVEEITTIQKVPTTATRIAPLARLNILRERPARGQVEVKQDVKQRSHAAAKKKQLNVTREESHVPNISARDTAVRGSATKKFVETHKLSDAEFELARAEGLIPVIKGQKVQLAPASLAIYNNKKAKARAMQDIRRKLNID